MIFCDNGFGVHQSDHRPVGVSERSQDRLSSPGKPTDTAHVKSFNGTLRAERLDTHCFATAAEAKESIEAWRKEYNETRPHRALGERTPNEFAKEH
jgi:putative transposase